MSCLDDRERQLDPILLLLAQAINAVCDYTVHVLLACLLKPQPRLCVMKQSMLKKKCA